MLDAYTEKHNQEIHDYWSGFWDSLKKNLVTEQILSMSATWEMFTQFNMDNTEELRRQFSINEYLKVMQTVDKEAYYSGRVDGDIASIIFGGIGMFAGTMTFLGGLGIGVGSMGTTVIVSVPLAIAGTVVAGYSGMVAFAGGKNLVGDWDKYQEEKEKAEQEASSSGSTNGIGENNPLLEGWGEGGENSTYSNALKHYNKHGKEVGAENFDDYLRKAEAFKETVLSKKKLNISEVLGVTPDVYRYNFNNKYIDLQYIYETDLLGLPKISDYKIISYGSQ